MAREGFFSRIIRSIRRTPPRAAPPPREPPKSPPPAPPRPPEEEEVFQSYEDKVRTAVKLQKQAFWEDLITFGRRSSDEAVDESDDVNEMILALRRENRSDATWTELASLASIAHKRKTVSGSAGELEMYLPYSFLWYHYLG